MTAPADLRADLPAHPADELFTTPLDADVRIDWVVSHGHASPDGFRYDPDRHEWVVVLNGAARFRIEDDVGEMRPGCVVNVPARKKHRVERTAPDEPAVRLAVHYGGDDA